MSLTHFSAIFTAMILSLQQRETRLKKPLRPEFVSNIQFGQYYQRDLGLYISTATMKLKVQSVWKDSFTLSCQPKKVIWDTSPSLIQTQPPRVAVSFCLLRFNSVLSKQRTHLGSSNCLKRSLKWYKLSPVTTKCKTMLTYGLNSHLTRDF